MTNTPPLTLLEELLILALNEKTGELHPIDAAALHRAAASSLLMELSLRGRIDYDLRDMFAVDPTPTGDDILDPVLRMIGQAPVLSPHSTIYWLGKLSDEGKAIVEKGLARLEKNGYIRHAALGMFWMFSLGSRPTVDEQKASEVKASLMDIVLGDKIPAPRTALLAGLIDSCGLFGFLLSDDDSKAASARIAELSHMDLINQAARSISNGEPVAAAAGR